MVALPSCGHEVKQSSWILSMFRKEPPRWLVECEGTTGAKDSPKVY
jgi:hypothetical protein